MPTQEVSVAGADFKMKVNINKAHGLLGYMNEGATHATTKELWCDITRKSMKSCEACGSGKAKQENISKNIDQEPVKENTEKIFINISSVKGKSDEPLVQSKWHWRIMVNEWTILTSTKFFATKNGNIDPNL